MVAEVLALDARLRQEGVGGSSGTTTGGTDINLLRLMLRHCHCHTHCHHRRHRCRSRGCSCGASSRGGSSSRCSSRRSRGHGHSNAPGVVVVYPPNYGAVQPHRCTQACSGKKVSQVSAELTDDTIKKIGAMFTGANSSSDTSGPKRKASNDNCDVDVTINVDTCHCGSCGDGHVTSNGSGTSNVTTNVAPNAKVAVNSTGGTGGSTTGAAGSKQRNANPGDAAVPQKTSGSADGAATKAAGKQGSS